MEANSSSGIDSQQKTTFRNKKEVGGEKLKTRNIQRPHSEKGVPFIVEIERLSVQRQQDRDSKGKGARGTPTWRKWRAPG